LPCENLKIKRALKKVRLRKEYAGFTDVGASDALLGEPTFNSWQNAVEARAAIQLERVLLVSRCVAGSEGAQTNQRNYGVCQHGTAWHGSLTIGVVFCSAQLFLGSGLLTMGLDFTT
jgi:hypothetical protein